MSAPAATAPAPAPAPHPWVYIVVAGTYLLLHDFRGWEKRIWRSDFKARPPDVTSDLFLLPAFFTPADVTLIRTNSICMERSHCVGSHPLFYPSVIWRLLARPGAAEAEPKPANFVIFEQRPVSAVWPLAIRRAVGGRRALSPLWSPKLRLRIRGRQRWRPAGRTGRPEVTGRVRGVRTGPLLVPDQPQVKGAAPNNVQCGRMLVRRNFSPRPILQPCLREPSHLAKLWNTHPN